MLATAALIHANPSLQRSPRIDMELGDVIAQKYRLERLLGEGGMGEVFAAVNVVTGKHVAIKWLHADLGRSQEYPARLMREAQVAARIDHPNVVNVFDVGNHDGSLFLVMELLQGETLASLLAHGPVDPTSFIQLMIPVLRGVSAAHRMGVVHRDLKPDNIFMCRGPHGEQREAKVLDFGISKIAEELGDVRSPLTRENTIFGTPQYMASEQVRSARSADARSDVYALGVIFYRALSGQFPYDDETLPSLALKIVEGNATHLNELCPELDPEFAGVIMRCLALLPDERYPSVAAFGEALEPFADGMTFSTPSAVWGSAGGITAGGHRTPASGERRGRTPISRPDTARTPASHPQVFSERSAEEPHAIAASATPAVVTPVRSRVPLVALVMLVMLVTVMGGIVWKLRTGAPEVAAPAPSQQPVASPPSERAAALAPDPTEVTETAPLAAVPVEEAALAEPATTEEPAQALPSDTTESNAPKAPAPEAKPEHGHVGARDKRRTKTAPAPSRPEPAAAPKEPEPIPAVPAAPAVAKPGSPDALQRTDSNPYLRR